MRWLCTDRPVIKLPRPGPLKVEALFQHDCYQ